MIPHKLTIEGLNSYQHSVTIDFHKLIEAQLFGIFGPVGSGKTTLLDAITLALYGKTERFQSRAHRGYNILNLKSQRLYIDLTCIIGNNHQMHRFTVEIKRQKKNFDKIGKVDRRAYFLEDNQWIPIAIEKAESLLALSYDNFRRTIVIPQGKFEEFLRLGGSERTNMIKELFKLDRFDLYKKVSHLVNDNRSALDKLEGELNGIGQIERKEVSALTAQYQTAQQACDALTLKENFLRQYRDILKAISINQQDLELSKRQLLEVNDKLQEIEPKRSKSHEKYETAKQQAQQIPLLEDKRKDLNILVQMKSHLQDVNRLEERCANGENMLHTAEITWQEKVKLHKIANKKLQLTKANKPAREKLVQVEVWKTKFEQLAQFIRESTLSIQRKAINLQDFIQQQVNNIAYDLILPNNPEQPISYLKQVLKEITESIKTLETEIQQEQAQIQHLNRHAHLDQLGKALREGEACPVCGSLEHPQPATAQGWKEKLQLQQKKIDHLQASLKSQLDNRHLLNTFINRYQDYKGELSRQQQKLEELIREKEAQQGLFPLGTWSKDWPIKIENFRQKIQQDEANIAIAEKDEKAAREELEEIRDKRDKYRKLLSKCQQEMSSTNARVATLLEQLTVLLPGDYELKSIADITLEKEQNDQTIAQLRQQLEQSKNQHRQFKEQHAQLITLRQQLTNDNERQQKSLDQRLISQKSLEKEKPINLSFTESSIDHTYTQTRNALNEANENAGMLKSRLQQAIVKLDKRKTILEQLTKLTVRKKNLNTILQLFRSNGFVNFVSSIYMRELCHTANARFRILTRQQLALEVNEDNDFMVRDYLNEGKLRSVKTLSGGQTFQASLCLALALADQVRRRHGADEQFFFMDEGFGSQDEASLLLVLQTLKELRKEGRIVGIISHVDSLKRDIDVYLSVENDEINGSRITPSWL